MHKQSYSHKGSNGWRLALSPMQLAFLLALVFVFNLALTLAPVGLPGSGTIVWAQADAPAALVPTREVTADEVNTVAREIWCPLCSGVRLDACELKACEQMKEVIAIKLAAGEDTNSIKAYFVEQYGPQVLGEPPRTGFNWLAWILPVVAVVAGAFFFWRTTQRLMHPGAGLEAGTPLDVSAPPRGGQASPTLSLNRGNTGAASGQASDKVMDEDDEYTQKLEEELAKYG